eukprot:scaffold20491_cov35-Cyclotella_meneghiniana.AAC.2
MNKERCNELNVSFVRGLGSAVSPENNKQRRVTWLLSRVECAEGRSKDAACSLFVMIHVERLTKAASFVAIAVWLRSPLLEVTIQFDGKEWSKGLDRGLLFFVFTGFA